MFWFSGHEACGAFAFPLGTKAALPVLGGDTLTTGSREDPGWAFSMEEPAQGRCGRINARTGPAKEIMPWLKGHSSLFAIHTKT